VFRWRLESLPLLSGKMQKKRGGCDLTLGLFATTDEWRGLSFG